MKYKLTKVGICNPSFFNGHKKPILQTTVWREMTKQELTDALVSEYQNTWDHLHFGEHAWPELTEDELRAMCDEFILTDTPFINSGIETLQESIENDMDESIYLHVIWEEADE